MEVAKRRLQRRRREKEGRRRLKKRQEEVEVFLGTLEHVPFNFSPLDFGLISFTDETPPPSFAQKTHAVQRAEKRSRHREGKMRSKALHLSRGALCVSLPSLVSVRSVLITIPEVLISLNCIT